MLFSSTRISGNGNGGGGGSEDLIQVLQNGNLLADIPIQMKSKSSPFLQNTTKTNVIFNDNNDNIALFGTFHGNIIEEKAGFSSAGEFLVSSADASTTYLSTPANGDAFIGTKQATPATKTGIDLKGSAFNYYVDGNHYAQFDPSDGIFGFGDADEVSSSALFAIEETDPGVPGSEFTAIAGKLGNAFLSWSSDSVAGGNGWLGDGDQIINATFVSVDDKNQQISLNTKYTGSPDTFLSVDGSSGNMMMGDTLGVVNGTTISINDSAQRVIIQSLGHQMLYLNGNDSTAAIGLIAAGNETNLFVDDLAQTVTTNGTLVHPDSVQADYSSSNDYSAGMNGVQEIQFVSGGSSLAATVALPLAAVEGEIVRVTDLGCQSSSKPIDIDSGTGHAIISDTTGGSQTYRINHDGASIEMKRTGDVWMIQNLNNPFTKLITPSGTTGDVTLNATSGSVNFASGDTSLTVTNSFANPQSVITATVAGSDIAMSYVWYTKSIGSFTLFPNNPPVAETPVCFAIIN